MVIPDGPTPFSRVATGPPAWASPTSRCSVETYSSPTLAAASEAAFIVASIDRDSCGAATVEPVAAGSARSSCSARARTAAGCAPTAVSSELAMPSCWSSSATSRCTGSTSG